MAKYYDFHFTMFIDEIKQCVENSGIDYKKPINGILTVDYEESFIEHKELLSYIYNGLIFYLCFLKSQRKNVFKS